MIQFAFSKPSLVNLMSKDANLVFFFISFTHWFNFQNGDYGIIIDFRINSTSLGMSLKKI